MHCPILAAFNKHEVQLHHKENLLQVEKHIGSFLSFNSRCSSTLSLLQGQLLQAPTQLQQPQSLDGHQQQQAKPQQTAQLPVHQMSQLHQMIDATDTKMRRRLGIKIGQQSVGQLAGSHHQQLMSGISSPQVYRALSPLVTPQIDQQNMLASLTKAGSLLQSATSPFVVPSPSTAWAPSPMPTGLAIHTAAGNLKHQQATVACAPAQSPAVGTPGISASPLLAEFSGLDGTHGNGSAVVSGKSSVEQPYKRLLKVEKKTCP
ncbi:hypothetical protein K7X08_022164 [Anisodus acutangulus]|uniref:Uncharacterized protein n=1 Tax=Anisodus acutangulus TaxID=402998 RepID=A0A9Q1L747_9SOLA|nr:hypothetical protein K7X08_022164 [Anisodus acutangulus]